MTFTNVPTRQVTPAGVTNTPTAIDATNGNVIDTGRIHVEITNSGGSSLTATLATPQTADIGGSLAVGPRTVVVAAGTTAHLGPLNPQLYGQVAGSANAGRCQVTFSGGSTGTIGVYQI
jgi:hypothetical protein